VTQRRLANAVELLDAGHHDVAELEESLDQVAEVNRLLGGQRAAWHGLAPLLDTHVVTSVLDIGTGSADIPLDLDRRARHKGVRLSVVATDIHPQMRAIARRRVADRAAISIGAADALALPYSDRSFDVVLLSLTLHHFEGADQLRALREAGLAATRWRRNRLTRHDGPLSVLRAFTTAELRELAAAAGLRIERLERRFFYRLLLVLDRSTQ
jgi:SAM-dependent methyltransferase